MRKASLPSLFPWTPLDLAVRHHNSQSTGSSTYPPSLASRREANHLSYCARRVVAVRRHASSSKLTCPEKCHTAGLGHHAAGLRRPETAPRCGEQQLRQSRVRASDSRTRHSPQSTPEGCLTTGRVVLPSVGSRGCAVWWSSSTVHRRDFLPCEPPLAAYKSS